MLNSIPSSAHAEHYAKIVKDKSMLRSMIQTANGIIRDAYESSAEPMELNQRVLDRAAAFAATKSAIRISLLEEILHEVYEECGAGGATLYPLGFPKLDVYENDTKYVVEYAMAGVDRDKIQIEITDDKASEFAEFGTRTLKVSGTMGEKFEHKVGVNYHVKELTRKSFSRSLILPDYITGDPVAEYDNGMLTLTFDLPVKAETKPHTKSISITDKEKND